jgi:hypothetical protein
MLLQSLLLVQIHVHPVHILLGKQEVHEIIALLLLIDTTELLLKELKLVV